MHGIWHHLLADWDQVPQEIYYGTWKSGETRAAEFGTTYSTVQGLSDLFNSDDVQDFDTRWDQALCYPQVKFLRKWSWKIFFTSKLQDSVQIQTVLTVCEQENIRNNEQSSNFRLMTAVRRHVGQANEDKKLQSPETK